MFYSEDTSTSCQCRFRKVKKLSEYIELEKTKILLTQFWRKKYYFLIILDVHQ